MSVMAVSVDAAMPPSARRAVWHRIGLLTGAVLLGLALNQLVRHHLVSLETLAATDPIAARRRLASEIRIGGLGLFSLIFALGAWLIPASLRAARDQRFPPPGMWSVGSVRYVSGPLARRSAYVMLVIGMLLTTCAAAGGWLSWEMATRLIACRAGVPTAAARH
jgi:hypothetical protein